METLYRDRIQSTLKRKKKLDNELVVLLYASEEMFIFRFQHRVMQNIEGDVQKLDGNCYRILMCEAHEEDTFSDIRERIANAINKVFSRREDLIKEAKGQREFFRKVGETWTIV